MKTIDGVREPLPIGGQRRSVTRLLLHLEAVDCMPAGASDAINAHGTPATSDPLRRPPRLLFHLRGEMLRLGVAVAGRPH
jgi:hypothetical protein